MRVEPCNWKHPLAKNRSRNIACMTVMFFSNPFMLGISNILGPRTAQAFADAGRAGVRRCAQRAMVFIAVAMSGFCAAVALYGEQVVGLLFKDPAYAGHGHTLREVAVTTDRNHALAQTSHAPQDDMLQQQQRRPSEHQAGEQQVEHDQVQRGVSSLVNVTRRVHLQEQPC